MRRLGITVALLCAAVALAQDPPPDLPGLLAKADALLGEARAAYDQAKSKGSVAAFVEAGFKLEEARIKYLVLQEIGNPELQKTAADRLRASQQLAKLINDGRVAVQGGAAPAVAAAPAPVAPPEAVPPPPPAPAEAAAPSPAPLRLPVPAVEALKESEKLVKELFKDQYAKKTPEDRQALARTLLVQAAKTKGDPASSYVLYREASDAAAQASDAVLALFATDETARFFEVDGAALRSSVLAACAKAARTPAHAYGLTEAYLKITEEAMSADQYEAAEKAMSAAQASAKKANAAPLAQRVAMRSKELSEAKSAFTSLKGHLAALAKSPEHPGANLGMGQYLCYVKGAWDLGMRFLALGSDAGMKALAQKEMAYPTTAAPLVELADGWAALAEKEKSPVKKGKITAHARDLYEAALPSAEGLLKTKIEKRLEGLGPEAVNSGPVDLLLLIDPARDAVAGGWKLEAGILAGEPAKHGRIQIPYLPPEEYDLVVTAERGSEEVATAFGLSHKEAYFAAVFDTWPPKCQYGLDSINNVDAWMNESTGEGRQMLPGKPVTFEFRVRKTGVVVLAEGKTLIRYSGDYGKLKVSWRWPTPNPKALFLGLDGGGVKYSKAVLTPVSGRGRRLR